MYRTATETTTRTLTRLITAMDHHYPVTITYTKADGSETVRTIEIYDVTTSAAGDLLVKAMDRESGEQRTFRLDRIVSYSLHRGATYLVPRDTTGAPTGHGLAAATAQFGRLHLLPAATPDRAVTVLTNLLAAA
jgi:predicted DNA-binding transcriptional regulator YafY